MTILEFRRVMRPLENKFNMCAQREWASHDWGAWPHDEVISLEAKEAQVDSNMLKWAPEWVKILYLIRSCWKRQYPSVLCGSKINKRLAIAPAPNLNFFVELHIYLTCILFEILATYLARSMAASIHGHSIPNSCNVMHYFFICGWWHESRDTLELLLLT